MATEHVYTVDTLKIYVTCDDIQECFTIYIKGKLVYSFGFLFCFLNGCYSCASYGMLHLEETSYAYPVQHFEEV